jgi:hypothetical protein
MLYVNQCYQCIIYGPLLKRRMSQNYHKSSKTVYEHQPLSDDLFQTCITNDVISNYKVQKSYVT